MRHLLRVYSPNELGVDAAIHLEQDVSRQEAEAWLEGLLGLERIA